MKKTLICDFLKSTTELALLSNIRVDGTYDNFIASIFVAFDKCSPIMKKKLLEIFLQPLIHESLASHNIRTCSALSFSFFASCPPFFFKSLENYVTSIAPDAKIAMVVKPQLYFSASNFRIL